MTALDAFDRLEATGIWRLRPEDEGIDVLVAFGEATVTFTKIEDGLDVPLTHWSLGAIKKLSDTENDAVYGLRGVDTETLTVSDQTLREALDKVLEQGGGPKHSRSTRSRFWIFPILLALLALGYFFIPGVVHKTALRMISPERAAILAGEMVPMIEERTGPACTSPEANKILSNLADRLHPGDPIELRVHDLGDANVISLPGGLVLLDRRVVEQASSPEQIAAWAALGIAGIAQSSAISGLFERDGLVDGLRFLATGHLHQTAKNRAVNRMLINAPTVDDETAQNAAQILKNANINTLPLTQILVKENPEIQLENFTPENSDTIMDIGDWGNLQRICG